MELYYNLRKGEGVYIVGGCEAGGRERGGRGRGLGLGNGLELYYNHTQEDELVTHKLVGLIGGWVGGVGKG